MYCGGDFTVSVTGAQAKMNRGEFLDKPVGAMPTMLQFPKEPLDYFTGENPHLVTNFICCFFCIAIIIRYHLLLRSLHTFRCNHVAFFKVLNNAFAMFSNGCRTILGCKQAYIHRKTTISTVQPKNGDSP